MRYPFFGVSPDQYADGKWPSIALNAGGTVVEIHDSKKDTAGLWRASARSTARRCAG